MSGAGAVPSGARAVPRGSFPPPRPTEPFRSREVAVAEVTAEAASVAEAWAAGGRSETACVPA